MSRLTNLRLLVLAAAIVPASAVSLAGQRNHGRISEHVERHDRVWSLRARPESGTLSWTIRYQTPAAIVTMSVPFDMPGDLVELDDDEFVVSGFDTVSQTGYLLQIRCERSPQQLVLVSSTALPLVDPFQLVWRPEELMLYVQDYQSSCVRAATFVDTPGFPLPDVGQMLESAPIAAASSLLSGFASGSASPGVVIQYKDADLRPGDGAAAWRVFQDGTTLSTVVLPLGESGPALPARAIVGWPSARGAILVTGPSGPCELRNSVTDEVVWSGLLQGSGVRDLQVPAGSLTPGQGYYIAAVPGTAQKSTSVVIHSRWGVPSPGTGGRLTVLPAVATRPRRGDSSHYVTGRIVHKDRSHDDADTCPVWLWVRVRGTDPVSYLPSGQAVMNSPEIILGPVEATIGPASAGHYAFHLPIPDAPETEGVELLFQVALVDTSTEQTVLSDVYGTQILGAATAAAVQAATASTALSDWPGASVCPIGHGIWRDSHAACEPPDPPSGQ